MLLHRLPGCHEKAKVEKIGWASEGYPKEMASNIRAERARGGFAKEEKDNHPGSGLEKNYEWLDTSKKKPFDDRSRWRMHLEKKFAGVPLSRISPIDLENLKIQL